MQFAFDVLGAETTVDGDAGDDLALQSVGVGVSYLEIGTARYAELDLRRVKLIGLFGRVDLPGNLG